MYINTYTNSVYIYIYNHMYIRIIYIYIYIHIIYKWVRGVIKGIHDIRHHKTMDSCIFSAATSSAHGAPENLSGSLWGIHVGKTMVKQCHNTLFMGFLLDYYMIIWWDYIYLWYYMIIVYAYHYQPSSTYQLYYLTCGLYMIIWLMLTIDH